MTICILDNDRLDAALMARWHSYGAMTAQLLREAGWDGGIEIHAAREGQYPEDMTRYDAVVLTGSGMNFSTGHAMQWLARMNTASEATLREQADLLATLLHTLDTLPKPTMVCADCGVCKIKRSF